MHSSFYLVLLVIQVIATAMMGGLYFVFSNFGIKALASVGPEAGMSAMQAINRTIQNPAFLVLFLGTTAASLFCGGFALLTGEDTTARWVIAGSSVYIIGMFLITVLFNVPLNEHLDGLPASDPSSVEAWNQYRHRWLLWNHVRLVSCLVAAVAYIVAILKATV